MPPVFYSRDELLPIQHPFAESEDPTEPQWARELTLPEAVVTWASQVLEAFTAEHNRKQEQKQEQEDQHPAVSRRSRYL